MRGEPQSAPASEHAQYEYVLISERRMLHARPRGETPRLARCSYRSCGEPDGRRPVLLLTHEVGRLERVYAGGLFHIVELDVEAAQLLVPAHHRACERQHARKRGYLPPRIAPKDWVGHWGRGAPFLPLYSGRAFRPTMITREVSAVAGQAAFGEGGATTAGEALADPASFLFLLAGGDGAGGSGAGSLASAPGIGLRNCSATLFS